MKSVWTVPIILFTIGNGIFAQEEDHTAPPHAPAWTQRVNVLESTSTARVYPWNIISGTSLPRRSPPGEGLRDFANENEPFLKNISASPDHSKNSSAVGPLVDGDFRVDELGEEIPTFWEAVAPATYTLEFATPFEIHRIDLTPPLRKIGFSDFTVLIQGATDQAYHPVAIIEATTARGPTLEAGYLWEFSIKPEETRGVKVEFERGTIDFPDRIFLKDIDVWGK